MKICLQTPPMANVTNRSVVVGVFVTYAQIIHPDINGNGNQYTNETGIHTR